MNLQQIIAAVEAGKIVYCGNPAYQVKRSACGWYIILCSLNNYAIGLTWADKKTLNDKEEKFYIHEPAPEPAHYEDQAHRNFYSQML